MGEKSRTVTNVVFAGLGGQGVLKASDILSEAAFRSGYDVKKSEIHGMSQRGGSVTSDVRFGSEVLSPMIPSGEADYLVALDSTQVEPTRYLLREGGTLIAPEVFLKDGQDIADLDKDPNTPLERRNLNVALLGVLSTCLDIGDDQWMAALFANLAPKLHAVNQEVFQLGREAGRSVRTR